MTADNQPDRKNPADKKAGSEAPHHDFMQHAVWKSLVGLALVGVIGAGAIYFTRKDHGPGVRQASATAQAMAVGVRVIERRDVPFVAQFLAQTEPSEIVPIRARVSGFLVEQGFEDGDRIEKGQVLFRIEPKPFEVALQRAEAGLKASQAQLVRAEQQVKRFEELAKLQQAAANELEQAQESLMIAASSVETQRAVIEQARLDLEYATVISPISGVIGMRQQDVGSYVGPGAEALLATVRKVDPLYVQYSVSERDLLWWQRMVDEGSVSDTPAEDLTVTVLLPDGREFPHTARIDYIDVAVNPSTGTAVVRSSVPNPELTLRPGQFVHARISGLTRLRAVTVPQSAVTQSPNGPTVYVVDADDVAQIRPVTLGDWSGDEWIVEAGLDSGDRVIVDHLMQVRPGSPVRPSVVGVQGLASPGEQE